MPEPSIEELTPKAQTSLEKIRKGLNDDERLIVAGESSNLPGSLSPQWFEEVDIFVSPATPIYDADKLNELMGTILPNMDKNHQDKVSQGSLEMSVGCIYFDELLATQSEYKRIVLGNVSDPDTLVKAGIDINDREEVVVRKMERRIRVNIYPDSIVSQTVYGYEEGRKSGTVERNRKFDSLRHRISMEDIAKLKNESSPRIDSGKTLGTG